MAPGSKKEKDPTQALTQVGVQQGVVVAGGLSDRLPLWHHSLSWLRPYGHSGVSLPCASPPCRWH